MQRKEFENRIKSLLLKAADDAEQVAENFYIIHLSNGKEIEVTERPVHNGNVWDWKVDSQVFDTDNV